MAQPQGIEKTPYQAIQQVDRDGLPIVDQDGTPIPPSPIHKNRSNWEKLGTYNLWVLVIGTFFIFLSIAVLAFLWILSIQSKTSGNLPTLWNDIVGKNWTSRVVTLATLVIRVALAAQLCVFAAIMAALVLERVGASAEDLPLLSMIRSLIWNVLHTVSKGTQLGYSCIIVVTIINAMALQFMSTMLFADFNDGLVVSLNQKMDIPWGIAQSREDTTESQGCDYWRSSQSSYPTFAEYKENASHGVNFVDTGKTYRGLLPFVNQTDRANILQYSGPMTIVDERVVCVKPTLSNAQFVMPDTDNYLSANLTFNNTHPDIIQIGSQSAINCTMPWGIENHLNYWHASICRLDLGIATFGGSILPDSDPRRHNETNVWLFFNVTTRPGYNWTDGMADPLATVKIPLRPVDSPDGPWARLGSPPNMTVDVSLCILNTVTDVYQADAVSTRETITADTMLIWDPKKHRLPTLAERALLDAVGPKELEELTHAGFEGFTHQNRGVMTLLRPDDWNSMRVENKYNAKYKRVIHGAMNKMKPWYYTGPTNDSLVITPVAGTYDAIHRNHMWLMQDILNHTNNPALALQAVSHIIMQTAYYDFFTNYDLMHTATYAMTQVRYIPQQFKHILVIAALMVLHFVLLAIALFLFVTKTEMSLLGNAWQAVAQVNSSDTATALHHGTYATDEEVLEHVRKTGSETRVIIRRSNQNGQSETVSIKSGH
ncbi:hypothetical protein GQ44DRAFT_731061 [Phaeosphaeriaceae sp. PMI808]|nr:hypothetical protein GQ44DRAFT_731061 [Phaeosphaeriaceae sp. PMI808]